MASSSFSTLSFSLGRNESKNSRKVDQKPLTLETLEGHSLGVKAQPQTVAEATPQTKTKEEGFSKVLLLSIHRLQAQVTSLSKDLQELKGIVHEIHRSI